MLRRVPNTSLYFSEKTTAQNSLIFKKISVAKVKAVVCVERFFHKTSSPSEIYISNINQTKPVCQTFKEIFFNFPSEIVIFL